jgi:hypothetical protein
MMAGSSRRESFWVTGAAVFALAVLVFGGTVFISAESNAQAAAQPVKAATALDLLPKLPDAGAYQLGWDGIQGLAVTELGLAPVTTMQPLNLVVAALPGRHRLGIRIRGANSGQVYRTSVWVNSNSPTEILLEVRDGTSAHSSKALIKLPGNLVVEHTGDGDAPAFEAGSNGWTRISVDMPHGDALDVVYISLFNSADAIDYVGDGHTALGFGGVELAPVD